jgi:hypothetical protein
MEMDLIPDSQMAPDSIAPDSIAPDSKITPDSIVVQDSVNGLNSVEAPLVVPDSENLLLSIGGLDSVDPLHSVEVLDSIIAQDSVDMVPESLPPGAFVCGSCHLVHEDREAWNRVHSRFYPCPRCGLIHADYSIDAMLGRIKLDCELFIEQYKWLLPGKDDAKAW